MAKGGKKQDGPEDEGTPIWGIDSIPGLQDAGKRVADLAQNPYARSLLAAGLLAAAAALASNKKVQKATRRNLKAASEAIEVGADSTSKIGLAMVNAATEAVQRILVLGAGAAEAGGAQEADAKPTTEPPAAARTPRARKAAGATSAADQSDRKPKRASAAPAGGATTVTQSKPRAKRKPVAQAEVGTDEAKSTPAKAKSPRAQTRKPPAG